jgi:hypothetical protein
LVGEKDELVAEQRQRAAVSDAADIGWSGAGQQQGGGCVSDDEGVPVHVRTRAERGSVGLGLTRPNQTDQVGPDHWAKPFGLYFFLSLLSPRKFYHLKEIN